MDYLNTHPESYHSLANYYNFALSKCNCEYIFKLDDDEIFFPNILRNLCTMINEKKCIGLRGINVFDLNKKLYVEGFTAGGDTLLFKYDQSCKFIKLDSFESFVKDNMIVIGVAICFYHTKFTKVDRGLNNYNLHLNNKCRYEKIFSDNFDKWNNGGLTPYHEYMNGKSIPNIFDLGFKYMNDSIKKYKYEKFNTLESKLSAVSM